MHYHNRYVSSKYCARRDVAYLLPIRSTIPAAGRRGLRRMDCEVRLDSVVRMDCEERKDCEEGDVREEGEDGRFKLTVGCLRRLLAWRVSLLPANTRGRVLD